MPKTPQEDVVLARQALKQGDLKHAIHHISCALPADPSSHEWLGVLHQIIERSDNPLELVELGGQNASFVTAATRAYILAQQGDILSAAELIGQCVEVRPDVGFGLWLSWWLSPHTVTRLHLQDLMPAVVIPLLKMTMSCPTPVPPDDPRHMNLTAAAKVLYILQQSFPKEPMLFFGASMLGRRRTTLDNALLNAQMAYSLEPGWKGSTAIANVYLDMQRLDDAVSWWQRAIQYDAKDLSARFDMGHALLMANRFSEAKEVYQEVLTIENDHPTATASLLFIRYKQHQQAADRQELLQWRAKGSNDRASELADRLDPPKAYINFLPRVADASSNAMRDVFEHMYSNPAAHHGSTFSLDMTHLESPSLTAAFLLQMEMWGPQVEMHMNVQTIPTPDPRTPKAAVDFQVWSYDGVRVTPNMDKPSRDVACVVSELAEQPFHIEWWIPEAKRIAASLSARQKRELPSIMCHPPHPPGSEWRVLVWVQRVQVAAALIIAHSDPNWSPSSLRHKTLRSLVFGPTDWSVSAAIIALGVVATETPAIRSEIIRWFQQLRSQIPKEGFTCYEYPLVSTLLAIGGHDADAQTDLEAWRQRIWDGQTGGTRVLKTELRPPQFNQEDEMNKARAAQRQLDQDAVPADPVVFPGQKVERLSDYVTLMKKMQAGDMLTALGQFGLDMQTYSHVMTVWGQRLQAEAPLNARFAQMMAQG